MHILLTLMYYLLMHTDKFVVVFNFSCVAIFVLYCSVNEPVGQTFAYTRFSTKQRR